MESIHIVTTCSDNYAKPLAVMLTSLIINKKSQNPLNIYVIDGGISPVNKYKLTVSLEKYHIPIHFLTIDPSAFNGFRIIGYFGKENYFRILIPQLLGGDVQKAIYLDSDIIIKEDITELWNINIDQYYLAAVEDPAALDRCAPLSIPAQYKYFNSGVLVFNLKKWRENNVVFKIMQYIRINPNRVLYMDQDALNANLYDKWLKLDPKWNYQTSYTLFPLLNKIKPAIIHYTTYKKPWLLGHPLQHEFFYYLGMTNWKD